MVALGWIHGLSSKWKPWVANHVSAIQSLTNPEQWRNIAGLENPADLVTRGVSAEKLISLELWWHRPTFFSELENNASDSLIVMPTDNADVEAERKVTSSEALLICVNSPCMFEMER